MADEVRWLCLAGLIFLSFIVFTNGSIPKRRFEYKYSFKPPYLAQSDGSVPFWEHGGDAIAASESVRVAPSMKSKKGGIWTKNKVNFRWWEVEIVFRVHGRGRVGADGLAFWYTTEKGHYDGTVYGSSDQWNGLGVFFDSFDNDNKHNNPYIMAMVNDGSKQFDHANDGSEQIMGGCLRDFRNKPFPTRAKIEYHNNVLSILFHNGMTNNDQDFEICARIENVYLPENGHFGVTAATGGLADDHDVFQFLTTALIPPESHATQGQINSEEQRRINLEYQDHQKKLDQQLKDYQRDHPDAQKEKEEDWFESDSQWELRQVFTGISHVSEALKELNHKVDEVVGRQERLLSLASQHPVVAQPVPGSPPGVVHVADTIRRNEVEAILQNQNTMMNTVRELRQFLVDINTRADQILQNQARQPTAQVQSIGYDMSSLVNQVRDGLNNVQQAVSNAAAQQAKQVPVCQPCLSSQSFLIYSAIILVLVLGYSIFRERRNQQSKKFY